MPVKKVAASTLPDVGLNSDAGDAYALDNPSVGRIVVNGSYAPFSPHLGPATMSVRGHSSIGGIFDGWVRVAPSSLVISLAPNASLTNTGSVGVYNHGSLAISGGAHSSFINNGTINTVVGQFEFHLLNEFLKRVQP